MTKQYSDPTNEQTQYFVGMSGSNPDSRTQHAMVRLGTRTRGRDGSEWVYVKATEAVDAASAVTVDTDTFDLTDANGSYAATVNFAAGDYGWVTEGDLNALSDDVA